MIVLETVVVVIVVESIGNPLRSCVDYRFLQDYEVNQVTIVQKVADVVAEHSQIQWKTRGSGSKGLLEVVDRGGDENVQ